MTGKVGTKWGHVPTPPIDFRKTDKTDKPLTCINTTNGSSAQSREGRVDQGGGDMSPFCPHFGEVR